MVDKKSEIIALTRIGKELREMRIRAGYGTSREFCRKFKIPESTYSQHERGKRNFSLKVLIKYARLLDCKTVIIHMENI